jgi:hypothetical protein
MKVCTVCNGNSITNTSWAHCSACDGTHQDKYHSLTFERSAGEAIRDVLPSVASLSESTIQKVNQIIDAIPVASITAAGKYAYYRKADIEEARKALLRVVARRCGVCGEYRTPYGMFSVFLFTKGKIRLRPLAHCKSCGARKADRISQRTYTNAAEDRKQWKATLTTLNRTRQAAGRMKMAIKKNDLEALKSVQEEFQRLQDSRP